ncbi:MAG TPA: hypothetical protein VK970_17260 [Candidatus Methylacidiphilales bacterium]|nr:hypothetical protein [Candidatus Methylacidiphilales bacterium]
MPALRLPALALAMTCASLASAHAHLVWFEQAPDKSIVLKFGDYLEKTETSPGHLDAIPETPAWTPGEKGPELAKATRGKEGVTYEKATADKPLFADIELAVRPPKADAPPSRTIYHPRWYVPGTPAPTAAVEPRQDFEIVPQPGDKVIVFLRGKPMPEIKLSVEEPDGKKQELVTDKDGSAVLKLTKPGLNLVIARFREDLGGWYRGVPYKQTSHIAVLSITAPTP